jgi:N-acetylglutamate synthase-like GNAT family acetyltransferase
LVGLCVTPELRKTGIATGLVAALMRYATNAGFDAAFATTQTATGLLTQLGWQRLRVFGDAKGQWDVLRVAL